MSFFYGQPLLFELQPTLFRLDSSYRPISICSGGTRCGCGDPLFSAAAAAVAVRSRSAAMIASKRSF